MGFGTGFVTALLIPEEAAVLTVGAITGLVGATGNYDGQVIGDLLNGKPITCINYGAVIGDGIGSGLGGILFAGAGTSIPAVVVTGANTGQLEALGAKLGEVFGNK